MLDKELDAGKEEIDMNMKESGTDDATTRDYQSPTVSRSSTLPHTTHARGACQALHTCE